MRTPGAPTASRFCLMVTVNRSLRSMPSSLRRRMHHIWTYNFSISEGVARDPSPAFAHFKKRAPAKKSLLKRMTAKPTNTDSTAHNNPSRFHVPTVSCRANLSRRNAVEMENRRSDPPSAQTRRPLTPQLLSANPFIHPSSPHA